MLPMFKPERGKKRKELMAEINHDIKKTFEETFAENYQSARENLIHNGVPEEKVDEKLSQIKVKLEQKMIINAQKLLREAVLEVAQEEMTKDSTAMPGEPKMGDAPDEPEKSGVSLT